MKTLLSLFMFLAITSTVLADSIRFELVTEAGFPITGAQRWMETLSKLDVDGVRIRSAGPADTPSINESGNNIRVVGVLTARNTLRLPGGNFSMSDQAGIARWIKRTKRDGEPNKQPDQAAFGLTSHELVALHQALGAPVSVKTKGQPIDKVVRSIASKLRFDVTASESVDFTLKQSEPVLDELKGMSSGTALASALRPKGLVLVPKNSPTLELMITDVRSAPESWPIGWPAEKETRELVPKFYDFVPVEILEQPIGDVLNVLQPRVKVPFLFDYNGLAREQIDLKTKKVSFPSRRTFYKKVIDQLLFRAKLKEEVRVDEAGKPFLWISPLKASRR